MPSSLGLSASAKKLNGKSVPPPRRPLLSNKIMLGYLGVAVLFPYNCEENIHSSNKTPESYVIEQVMDLYMDWAYYKPAKKAPLVNK